MATSAGLRRLFVIKIEVLSAAAERSILYGGGYLLAAEELQMRGLITIGMGDLFELQVMGKSGVGFIAAREDCTHQSYAIQLTERGERVLEELDRFCATIPELE